MPNAAVVGSKTFCPLLTPGTPPVPHTGGTVVTGATSVMICGQPAARMGDNILCNGAPPHPDTILKGSKSVTICKMPAAYATSSTAGGGTVIKGALTVTIGM